MTPTPRTDAHSVAMESEDFDVELAKTYTFARQLERENAELLEALEAQESAEKWMLDNEPNEPFYDETVRLKLDHATDLRRAAIAKAKGKP